jgi:hypothetical protein
VAGSVLVEAHDERHAADERYRSATALALLNPSTNLVLGESIRCENRRCAGDRRRVTVDRRAF